MYQTGDTIKSGSPPDVQVGVGTGDHGANLLTTAFACSLTSGFSFRSQVASRLPSNTLPRIPL